MVLLFIPIAWILTAAGRQLARLLRLPASASSLERSLIGFALGLGMLSYGLLLIGLAKLLYPMTGLIWVLLLAVIGGREHGALWGELARSFSAGAGRRRISPWAIVYIPCALIALCGVFTPPVRSLPGTDFTEWDSIAYHLADPKLYLKAHAIYYIPWESHSNFGFTAEMWYTLGLMAGGSVPLAKMFHFACGVGTALAVYAFGKRYLSSTVGAFAAAFLAATPVVFWEAGTAYADLAPTFYCSVALLALANAFQAQRSNSDPAAEAHLTEISPTVARASLPVDLKTNPNHWLYISAILMGLMLSTKATALATLLFGAIAVLVWGVRTQNKGWGGAILHAALWSGVAFVAGSPWLIKSFVNTGNPIYPFYYHLFGGRYWTAENAASYDASNAAFGMGRALREAILAPWNLTMYSIPGHPMASPKQSFNDYPSAVMSLGPVFLGSLFLAAFSRAKVPRAVTALALYSLASLSFWFATMQYVRYLMPLIPTLCLLSAWAIHRAVAARSLSGYAMAALAGCSFIFSLCIGGNLALKEAPVVFGQVSRDQFIQQGFRAYAATQFINTQLPANTKVVMYGSPFGFYCEKPYLWGESGHSTYIPYDQFHSPEDLKNYLHKLGVTRILVDPAVFPLAPGDGYPGWVYALTIGSGPPLFAAHGVAVFAVPS